MSLLYVDCSFGADDSRLLGALIAAEADLAAVNYILQALPGTVVSASSAGSGSEMGFAARIECSGGPDRACGDLVELAGRLQTRPWIRQQLQEAIRRSATALGPAASIPEPVAAALFALASAAEALDIEGLECSALGMGSPGSASIQATGPVLRAAAGLRIQPSPLGGGESTLSAVAFLAGARRCGPMPAMRLLASGCGIAAEGGLAPMRVLVGEIEPVAEADLVVEIQTNIDDMPAQVLSHVMGMLFSAGALDVFFTPIQMKKNRPAVLLSVLCSPHIIERCAGIILRETTSLGVRIQTMERRRLPRRLLNVETPYGAIPVKVAILDGAVRSVTPEYDVCHERALEYHEPLRRVQDAAVQAANALLRQDHENAKPRPVAVCQPAELPGLYGG